jgi:adenosylhomocysteine nucleosidase
VLIEKFNITHLIFTGVAGGTHGHINIGDIIISENLYQHDMDATPIFKKHEIPFTGKIYFDADKTLIQKSLNACNTFLRSSQDIIPHHILKTFNIDHPKVLLGTIGSGDQFITDIEKINEILSDRLETAAIEMEGAAVAQVCDDFKLPFVVIRTISDKANSNAHIDFTKFVKEVASLYSAHIVRNICASFHLKKS